MKRVSRAFRRVQERTPAWVTEAQKIIQRELELSGKALSVEEAWELHKESWTDDRRDDWGRGDRDGVCVYGVGARTTAIH